MSKVTVGDIDHLQRIAAERPEIVALGMRSLAHNLPESTSPEELLALIDTLNADAGVDGSGVEGMHPAPGDTHGAQAGDVGIGASLQVIDQAQPIVHAQTGNRSTQGKGQSSGVLAGGGHFLAQAGIQVRKIILALAKAGDLRRGNDEPIARQSLGRANHWSGELKDIRVE